MDRFSFPTSSKAAKAEAATRSNLQENPFDFKLERLDVLDLGDNNEMKQWIEFKKGLLDEAKLMRQLCELDQFSDEKDPEEKKTKTNVKKKANKMIIGEEDDGTIVRPEIVEENAEENKQDEEATDEEEEGNIEEDIEEDNDYMDTYFDNGEDYEE